MMRRWRGRIILALIVLAGLTYTVWPTLTRTPPYATVPVRGPYNVITVGGSVSYGWGDPKGGGYLKRAFRSLSAAERADYQIIAQEWMPTLANYKNHLAKVHPNMIVLAFGLLDTLQAKMPLPVFRQLVAREITAALHAGCAVLVTTPVITKATYTEFKGVENEYARSEIQVAKSLHSPHVYTFDLLGQMEAYVADHHQSYTRYMHDNWHPNAAGHALAGSILATDMENAFRRMPLWTAIQINLSRL